jgi:hypothetical protein
MNITITFDVDGTAAADIFSLLLKAQQMERTFLPPPPPATVTKTGDGPLSVEPADQAPLPGTPAKKPGASNEQMAKLRKLAQAKKAAEAAAKAGPVETVLGPASAEDLSGNGADTDGVDTTDDMGLTPPSMSPAEAKEAGLALVRSIYASGHVAEVKELQRAWKITKFYDIPDADGHDFYAQVVKLAQQTGIQR